MPHRIATASRRSQAGYYRRECAGLRAGPARHPRAKRPVIHGHRRTSRFRPSPSRAAPPTRGSREAMLTLAAHLLERGRAPYAPSPASEIDFGTLPVTLVPEAELARGADLLVAVGGDGTMLHAARMAAAVDVPVLGVNRGRLGFLADVGPDRMLESVDDALEGRCQAETRMLLEAQPAARRAAGSAAWRSTTSWCEARDRAACSTCAPGGRRLRQHPRRRRLHRLHLHRLHGLRAVLRRPHRPPEPRRDRARADLPAHALRPADRGRRGQHRRDRARRPASRPARRSSATAWCSASWSPASACASARAPVRATLLHPPGHDYYRILRSKLHWGRGARDGQPPVA